MKMDERDLLDKTIEITKEYARGGGSLGSFEYVLDTVYKKLKELNDNNSDNG